jgi:hypothetical protein
MTPIQFEVSYGLKEYLQIVRECARPVYDDEIKRRGKTPGKIDAFLFSILHTALMAPIFVWKKIRIGRCKFSIDESGVTRRAKDGIYAVTWNDVTKVQRLPASYVVSLSSGAMPLPFRCFSAEERERFEAHVSSLEKLA